MISRILVASIIISAALLAHGITEMERLEEHFKRYGEDWPPEFVPNTPGWRRLMEKRFRQAQEVQDRTGKYDAYIQVGAILWRVVGLPKAVEKNSYVLHLASLIGRQYGVSGPELHRDRYRPCEGSC